MKWVKRKDEHRTMGKILDAFADGSLCVEEEFERRSPEHMELSEKACRLQEELEEKLNDEERELLSDLVDTVYEECCSYAQNRFIHGYRLGVLMTMEIFDEQDTYIME